MRSYTTIQDWDKLVREQMQNSNSVAIGVFNKGGELLDANVAMCYFLDADANLKNPRNSFVNPDFKMLAQMPDSGKIFEGIMTLGNFGQISYSLQTSVYRQDDRLLVLAEPDVPQLFIENKKMSRLNQDVNNLQRQLIKEKSNLQATLNELQETQQMLVHSEKMNAMGNLLLKSQWFTFRFFAYFQAPKF